MQARVENAPTMAEISPLEIASRYAAGETIYELRRATGYSQRRVRTAIAKSGVPFRRKGRRLHRSVTVERRTVG